MRRALLLPLSCLLVLTACGSPRVALRSGGAEGERLRYSLRLEADLVSTLQGNRDEQRVVATFRTAQEVLEAGDDGTATVAMALTPVSLSVDGRAQNVGPEQRFVVTLAPDGSVRSLEDAEGAAAEPLELVGIERLLPRLRPVLPERAVGPGDRWSAVSTLEDEAGTFSVTARSRLERLGTIDGRDAALVRTIYTSPVAREEVFANAFADLEGTDVGTQAAWFGIGGTLLRSEGDSLGRYRITFRPPDARGELMPVEGTLEVELHTELSLVG